MDPRTSGECSNRMPHPIHHGHGLLPPNLMSHKPHHHQERMDNLHLTNPLPVRPDRYMNDYDTIEKYLDMNLSEPTPEQAHMKQYMHSRASYMMPRQNEHHPMMEGPPQHHPPPPPPKNTYLNLERVQYGNPAEKMEFASRSAQDMLVASWAVQELAGREDQSSSYTTNNAPAIENYSDTRTTEDKSEPIACLICGLTFVQKRGLQYHMMSKHDQEKPFKCDECEYRSHRKDQVKNHKLIHLKEKPIKCELCDYRCILKYKLRNHMMKHFGSKPYGCELCSFRSHSKHYIKKHMFVHIDEKAHACHLCPYKAKYPSLLRRHIKRHTEEPNIKCELCDHKCRTKESMKYHMKTHLKEKPFKCPQCKYSCITQGILNDHMKIHSTEKPFACTKCDYRCVSAPRLRKHMMTHLDKKPYECPTCEKGFINNCSLQYHMRRHTGIKPFKCPICPYSSYMKSGVTKHLKSHLGGNKKRSSKKKTTSKKKAAAPPKASKTPKTPKTEEKKKVNRRKSVPRKRAVRPVVEKRQYLERKTKKVFDVGEDYIELTMCQDEQSPNQAQENTYDAENLSMPIAPKEDDSTISPGPDKLSKQEAMSPSAQGPSSPTSQEGTYQQDLQNDDSVDNVCNQPITPHIKDDPN